MFIGSLKKLFFSFLRSKFDLYQGNSALSARFFCGTLPKNVCNFLIIRGTIRKKTPLSHARPAATVVAPPLPRPPGSGANMPPALRPPVWDRSQGAQKDVRELSVILGALGALCHPSQHRRMSGTRQKEPGSTEGCQGAVCHPGSPGSSLSLIHKFINSYIYINRYIVLFCQETRKLFKKNKKFSVFSCKFRK